MSPEIEDFTTTGPTRLGIHTVEGFGKTTLAAYFPKPIFIAPENGFPRDLPLRPKRFKQITRWEELAAAIEWLRKEKHDFETLVIDTVDWLEPLLHRYLCERDSGRKTEMNKGGNKLISIEDYGYGRGYVASEEEFRKLIALFDLLQYERGMHVVLLMHSHVKKTANPSGLDFDRWIPKMHERIARVCLEWCENVIFGYYEVEAGKLGDEKKAKGVSTGRRLLGTVHNAMYDAKNRMSLPETMELGNPDEMIPCLLGWHLDDAEPRLSAPTDRSGRTVARGPRAEPEPPKPEPTPEPAKPQRTASAPPSARPMSPQVAAAKDANPPEPATKAAPQTVSFEATNDLMRRLSDALSAAKQRPPRDGYAADVEAWVKKASGDAAKIEAIITRVNRECEVSA